MSINPYFTLRQLASQQECEKQDQIQSSTLFLTNCLFTMALSRSLNPTRVLSLIFLLNLVHICTSFVLRGYGIPVVRFRSDVHLAKPVVSIEYCTGCKWLLRSAWLAQELLTTFEKDLGSVSLQPNSDSPGGAFIVRVDGKKIWDRRDEATKGFPEAKILKQLIRDEINPEMSLGHSESKVIELAPE